jgi:hydroxyacylglutathione hydrolase
MFGVWCAVSKQASEFQKKALSPFFRGKGIFKPLNTGYIDERVGCIREYAANIFFYTKSGTTIMVDAGYNYGRLREKMSWLDIDPTQISKILITHQDTDHVGALETDSDLLFRNATLYIGETENRYLTGERRRKLLGGLYRLPQVRIENDHVLLKDGDVFSIDGIKIECILVPGHTWGHLVYLIDDAYLFTGDTIWLGADGGYSFINLLAESNTVSKASLAALEQKLQARRLLPMIITGHSGWTDSMEFAFAHRDRVCNAWVKQKLHDPTAPDDAFDESDDTEEQARSVKLKKQNR